MVMTVNIPKGERHQTVACSVTDYQMVAVYITDKVKSKIELMVRMFCIPQIPFCTFGFRDIMLLEIKCYQQLSLQVRATLSYASHKYRHSFWLQPHLVYKHLYKVGTPHKILNVVANSCQCLSQIVSKLLTQDTNQNLGKAS